MQRWLHTLAHELFDFKSPETTGERIYFRVIELFLVFYALLFCWNWGLYIQQNVSSVLLPLGIAKHVDISFMFDHHLALVNAGLVTVLCGVGVFRLWRPAYFVALLLFHLQYVSRYCLGEISHGSNLVGMGILGLGLAHLYFRTERYRRRFTLGFLYFFIGLGYTSAAVCKLIGTGITWPDGHHLLMWIAERKVDVMSKFGAFEPTMLQELVLQDYRFGTLFLTFGLLAELSGVLMWWRRYRYAVVLAVLGMHIGIFFTMNIMFHASTYLLVLLGLPWHRLIDRFRSFLQSAHSPQGQRRRPA